MTVHQCDNCKKIIGRGEQVIVGRDTVRTYVELCPDCAKPVMKSVGGVGLAPELMKKIKEKSKYGAY